MNRLCTSGLAVLLAAGLNSHGQDWSRARLAKSPGHLEWVDVKHNGRVVRCFVAYAQGTAKTTAVVLVHELFGLSDWTREVADELAEAGYLALAPDLLKKI
jgi:carboxymethylenebutenolidase